MPDDIAMIDRSDHVESLLARYKDVIGPDYDAYRGHVCGHVYRGITYAMHFLGGNPAHRRLVETAFVYHDIVLWTSKELAYLEPSEAIALEDNQRLGLGLPQELLRAAIHWHHKITPYSGPDADVVNAVRKADWIDASQGLLTKGLSRSQVRNVERAISNYGFPNVLQRLAKDLGGSKISGNLRVLRRVFKL